VLGWLKQSKINLTEAYEEEKRPRCSINSVNKNHDEKCIMAMVCHCLKLAKSYGAHAWWVIKRGMTTSKQEMTQERMQSICRYILNSYVKIEEWNLLKLF
jgi:hypothetical protein